jgi:hypothetical protein
VPAAAAAAAAHASSSATSEAFMPPRRRRDPAKTLEARFVTKKSHSPRDRPQEENG